MDISVVVPLLNEEESLPELEAWIRKVMETNGFSYEIILVDDGSKDNSWKVIEQLAIQNPCVSGIKFRRNYGKSGALNVAFAAAKGDVVITMDADLQDSPDEIPELYTMIRDQGFDLVSGWKKKRYDPALTKNIPSKLYNWAARKMSGIHLHDFNCGLKSYRLDVVKSIEVYGEMHRYIPMLAKWAGFSKIGEKVVEHRARKYGVTKFGLERFINGFLDLLTISFVGRFGKKPMHFFGTLGVLFFTIGFVILSYLSILKLIYSKYGIADLPLFYFGILTIIIGTQLFVTGFLAELVTRNAAGRNDYLIEQRIEGKKSMKVITLLSPAYPLRGGIASSTERLAQELQQQGYQVNIISFSLQYPGFLFPGKTQYTTDPPPEGLTITQEINSVNPLNWLKIGLHLRRARPDLIIARFWLPFMGPSLGAIMRLAKSNGHTRVIALTDNIIPHERRFGDRLFTWFFLKAADAFLVMSKSVEQDARTLAPGKPVALAPHPVYDNYGDPISREAALAHLGLPAAHRYLLFFGFIRAYKGLDLLLGAMADPRIREGNIRLIVAGEYYGNQEEYERLIERLGIRDLLILQTDYIPNDAVKYYFSAADLVAQPYRSATQSGISQLAYHFEKPMLATNVGGLPETVAHGQSGYIVEVNETAIADAIVDFYDQNRQPEMTAWVAQAKGEYSWGNMVKVIEDLMI